MRLVVCLTTWAVLLGLFACNESSSNPDALPAPVVAATPPSKPVEAIPYLYTVFMIDSQHVAAGYGYNILLDSAIFIHQPSIPAVQGNHGFVSASDAGLTASLVINKLLHHISPPSVSVRELDSLGVLN